MDNILTQLYKRTKNGMVPLYVNNKYIEVNNLENVTEELLNKNYSDYELVIDRGNGNVYRQYEFNKWAGIKQDEPGPTPVEELYVYSGHADSPENISIEDATKLNLTTKQFITADGEDYIIFFAIPANCSVISAENVDFTGDFIQDDLVQLDNITIDDIEYSIYYYEFLGIPSSNKYKITFE